MEELLASQSSKSLAVERGQEVEGEIIFKTDSDLILNIGAKSDGIISLRDLSDSQAETIKVGDKLKTFVVEPENESGQVILSLQRSVSKSTSSQRGPDWQKFVSLKDQGTKLKGRTLEANKGGLVVEVDGTRGFLPSSQLGFEALSKPSDLMGQDLEVTVIEVDPNNNRLIFSQKTSINSELKERLSGYSNNQKIEGEVTYVGLFGVIIKVGEVFGLVPIQEISWEREENPTEKIKVGQKLKVNILSVDQDFGRLNLSIKGAEADPLADFVEKVKDQDVLKGTVSQVEPSGITVKLEDTVEGFVAASKLDTTYEVGQSITVSIDSVDGSKRRINLSPFITTTKGLMYK